MDNHLHHLLHLHHLQNNTFHLYDHKMDCNGTALNQFQLISSGDNIKMEYTCSTGGSLGNVKDGGTATSNARDHLPGVHCAKVTPGNIGPVGPVGAITKLKMARVGDYFRWDYGCAHSTDTLKCRDVETEPLPYGDGSAKNLAQHNVQCKSNEVLVFSGFIPILG